ncbi:MAG: ABC transporter ATP-binding protein [Planctomycetota bacterium]
MVSVRLRAERLALRYRGGPSVLEDLDLDLSAGELVAVVGLNGAGKSTLLRALAGLLPAADGRVLLDGTAVHTLSAQARAQRIAFVPQALASLPPTTVERFVLGGRYAHLGFLRLPGPHDHATARAALAQTDVTRHAERPLAELSGGERQRVLVARALAQQAAVLLCDEPVAAFDLPHQLELLDLLAELARSGHVVALSTHDLNLASQYADRIAVLHEGRLLVADTPARALSPETVAHVWGRRLRVDRDDQGRPRITPARQPGAS